VERAGLDPRGFVRSTTTRSASAPGSIRPFPSISKIDAGLAATTSRTRSNERFPCGRTPREADRGSLRPERRWARRRASVASPRPCGARGRWRPRRRRRRGAARRRPRAAPPSGAAGSCARRCRAAPRPRATGRGGAASPHRLRRYRSRRRSPGVDVCAICTCASLSAPGVEGALDRRSLRFGGSVGRPRVGVRGGADPRGRRRARTLIEQGLVLRVDRDRNVAGGGLGEPPRTGPVRSPCRRSNPRGTPRRARTGALERGSRGPSRR